MFLALTKDKKKWEENREILLLGEWCIDHNNLNKENKYKVFYLFNEQKLKQKNFKIKNKIFYKLNKKSSIWVTYFLHFLRISNHDKCKTFKAITEWHYPSYRALKQIFEQEKIKKSFLICSSFMSTARSMPALSTRKLKTTSCLRSRTLSTDVNSV